MAEATTTVKVTCSGCGTEHTLKIATGKGDAQRWACPNCKARHASIAN
jgi:transposase-like protein